ncbi:protein YIPF5 homolog [Lycorma delicatula]|uniref:protein YIPF5 homolog n=1 Tax=Lycorma delicatula TaxID=130591 RepID=UPI003F50EF47
MSGYWYSNNSNFDQSNPQTNFAYNNDEFVKNAEHLNFHDTVYQTTGTSDYNVNPYSSSFSVGYDYYNSGSKVPSANYVDSNEFDDEPPLLEELGIDVEQIVRKVVSVLDPFTSTVTIGEYDLAGPLAFCIALTIFLLISGGKAYFGYVYGLAVISCTMMYVLLKLMTSTSEITFMSVASVLGYALLPIVMLSGAGVVITLQSSIGFILASVAVIWSSLAASRIFVIMSADRDQRPLIAYPCALLYSVFVLLVIF